MRLAQALALAGLLTLMGCQHTGSVDICLKSVETWVEGGGYRGSASEHNHRGKRLYSGSDKGTDVRGGMSLLWGVNGTCYEYVEE
jgi:hypothetical protein